MIWEETFLKTISNFKILILGEDYLQILNYLINSEFVLHFQGQEVRLLQVFIQTESPRL